MLSFLQTLVDFISMIGSFVVNLLSATLQMLIMLPKAMAFVTSTAGFVPSVILSFILAGIALSLLFMIVGRN